MHYVISGIHGWLGHAAVNVLKKDRDVTSENILGINRTSGEVLIGPGNPIKVATWDEATALASGPITFLHFAFLTRDKIDSFGQDEFTRMNRELIRAASQFIHETRPISVISASSGAVYENSETQELTTDLKRNPYGVLKLEEEAAIALACKDVGATRVIVRLWNLSGQDIQNTPPFVIANFILDALSRSEICIESDFRVFRRYVDARELILLMLTIAESDTTLLFESGGPLVEIRDLAREIALQLPKEITINDPRILNQERDNRYYSRSDQYEELCRKYLQHEPLSITGQVKNTIHGLSLTQ